MRIRTQFNLLAVLLVVLLVVTLVILFKANKDIQQRNSDLAAVEKIVSSINALRGVAIEVLVNPDQEIMAQWDGAFASLSGALKTHSSVDMLKYTLIGQMHGTEAELIEEHDALINVLRNRKPGEEGRKQLNEVLKKLLGTTKSMLDDAAELSELHRKDAASAENKIRLIGLIGEVAMFPVVVLLIFFGRKRILQPIARLQQGTEIITQGNLKHRININSKDEIGELARAFDQMAESLDRELHARQASLQALKESETRFRHLTDLSADWFWEMDANLHFSLLTGGEEQVRRWSKSPEQRGWMIPGAIARTSSWEDHIAICEAHQPFRNFELMYTGSNGKPLYLSVNGVPIFKDDGTFVGYHGSVCDITEQVVASEQATQLRASKEAADLANRTKSTFLASMSHELRTPLNSIIGFTQLLQTDPALKEMASVQKKLNHIFNGGKHLLAMVEDILDLSRIETGALNLSIEPVNVEKLLSECLALTRQMAEKRNVTCHFSPQSNLSWISGDHSRLKQVFVNIITNAIKYNRESGTIFIDINRDESRVSIAIRDTGNGLSPDQMSKLFQPFNRLGAENSTIEGTGIGLVIVQQMVEKMKGSIAVTSTVGVGTTFTLQFPRATPPQPKLAEFDERLADQGVLKLTGARHTVLCVEDNPANIDLIKAILQRNPAIHLEIATDGLQGLHAAQTLVPDLILLDINLPGMNGNEVLQQIKNDPALQNIPCMAITANDNFVNATIAKKGGFTDYISKPFDGNQLLARINTLLNSR